MSENDNEIFESSSSTPTPDLQSTEILYPDIEELLATFEEPVNDLSNGIPIEDAEDAEINNNYDEKKSPKDPRTYTITITYVKREKKKV